jgi:hypothetical protein
VERAAAVASVWIAPEIRVRLPLLEQRCEVGLKFGTKEVSILRLLRERGSQERRELAAVLGRLQIGQLVPSATANR